MFLLQVLRALSVQIVRNCFFCDGWVKIVDLNNLNHYYDARLKETRLNELERFKDFNFVKGNLADKTLLNKNKFN